MNNKKIKFSVVIPVYNEEKSIAKIIEKVKSVNYPGTLEIITVDDYSTDKTREVLKKIRGIKKFYNDKNYGKGYSLKKGFREATGEIILVQDADLEYNPQDHLKIIEKFKDQKINVVFGSRFLNTKPKARYRLFYMGNIFLSLITRILYGQKITDMETCYKSFRKKAIDKISLSENRFGIEPEITCKLIQKGHKIHEVPISYKSRSYKEGKKIGIKDGIYAVYLLFKYKFIN